MATIVFTHTRYQITRALILPAGAHNGKPGAIRLCATEIDHGYAASDAWRAEVFFDYHYNPAATDARFVRGWYYSSNNLGTLINNPDQVAMIDAALADYINEIDLDQRDAELTARADAATDADTTPAVHPYRAETITRALAQSLYITDAMVTTSATLREVATDFVATYAGTNSFVQDIAVRLADRGYLSAGQMRGALNVMLAEAKLQRAEDKADALYFDARHNDGADSSAIQQHYIDLRSTNEKTVDDAGAPPAAEDQPLEDRRTPNGTYTVILDRDADTYRTIRLADAPDHFNAAPGTQIASFLNGADNDSDFSGFAFVVGSKITLWKKFANSARAEKLPILNALDILVTSADPIAHMREYVLRSARCGVCGRKLTTPDSIRAGIGPICRRNLASQGFTFELPKEARAILAAVKTIEANAAPKTKEERAEAARRALADVNELFD